MPVATRSTARPLRGAVPGQSIAKRRESIAAFEQWQRNWSTSLQDSETVVSPERAVLKRSDVGRPAAHSR